MTLSGMGHRVERKRTAEEVSKGPWTLSKPELHPCSGIRSEETCLLADRQPAYRRREYGLGLNAERGNLSGRC